MYKSAPRVHVTPCGYGFEIRADMDNDMRLGFRATPAGKHRHGRPAAMDRSQNLLQSFSPNDPSIDRSCKYHGKRLGTRFDTS